MIALCDPKLKKKGNETKAKVKVNEFVFEHNCTRDPSSPYVMQSCNMDVANLAKYNALLLEDCTVLVKRYLTFSYQMFIFSSPEPLCSLVSL